MRIFLMMGCVMGWMSLLGMEAPEKWVVYYSDKASHEEFEPYSLLVLDSDAHPTLRAFREKNKRLLGYLSLGEVEQHRAYFKEVKEEGILLGENPNWPGSFYVDVRDSRWKRRVIEELVPHILFKRFDGIFIDTLDNPGYLEAKEPEKYKGMTKAAAELVEEIREQFPEILIMLNRAYEILPRVARSIDMELGESIYTDYNFETKTYQKVPESAYQEQVALLQEAEKINPKLEIYTLDYWDPNDQDEIREIYRTERLNGFIPYVSTIELNEVVQEP